MPETVEVGTGRVSLFHQSADAGIATLPVAHDHVSDLCFNVIPLNALVLQCSKPQLVDSGNLWED